MWKIPRSAAYFVRLPGMNLCWIFSRRQFQEKLFILVGNFSLRISLTNANGSTKSILGRLLGMISTCWSFHAKSTGSRSNKIP